MAVALQWSKMKVQLKHESAKKHSISQKIVINVNECQDSRGPGGREECMQIYWRYDDVECK